MFYDENLDLDKLKQRQGITEKQRKFIRQLEDANRKVRNFEKEVENIRKKTEISDSQANRIEMLDAKLEEIKGEREMIEEKLRSSFFENYQPFKKKVKGLYDYSSDEDEFYNRAKRNNSKSSELSLIDLQEKLGKLLAERIKVKEKIEKFSLEEIQESEDPLDVYMNANEESLKRESLDLLAARLGELNAEIDCLYEIKPGLNPKMPIITQEEIVVDLNIDLKTDEIRTGNKRRKIYGAEERLISNDQDLACQDLDFYNENEA